MHCSLDHRARAIVFDGIFRTWTASQKAPTQGGVSLVPASRSVPLVSQGTENSRSHTWCGVCFQYSEHLVHPVRLPVGGEAPDRCVWWYVVV